MAFNKEFKTALSQLPAKEKDKLVLRLLRKDAILAKRLYFELIEEDDVDQKRAQMEERVKQHAANMLTNFHSPGDLMMDLRFLSGDITEHVKVTGDKFGEASLNLCMLNNVMGDSLNKKMKYFHQNRSYKLAKYMIQRSFKILLLINKLHEDYFSDFEDDIQQLGQRIGQNHAFMKVAIQEGLDVNWLISADIPEDIQEIHKRIKTARR